MKKTKILLSMLAVAGLMVMGTSCSDDDDTVVNTQTNTGQTDQTTDTDTGGVMRLLAKSRTPEYIMVRI